MPVYEYRCRRCGNTFEELIFGPSDGVSCADCGADDVTKLVSRFAFAAASAGSSGRSSCCGGSCSGSGCADCSCH